MLSLSSSASQKRVFFSFDDWLNFSVFLGHGQNYNLPHGFFWLWTLNSRQLNHGLELTPDGKTLFVSSVASVFAYPYNAADGTVGTKATVITGMSISGSYHLTRTLRIPSTNPGLLLVQVGSNGNIDSPTTAASSGRSQVRVFNIASILATPTAYTGGAVLAYGLRNSVGWGVNPKTGGVVSNFLCI